MPDRAPNFRSFWPHYLRAHSDPNCRRLHYLSSTGALAALALSVALADPAWIVAGIAFGYGMAWIGHFFIERNRPATFGNPVYSLLGDYRMYFLWLSGRLQPELERNLKF
jgi:hypothetical protein